MSSHAPYNKILCIFFPRPFVIHALILALMLSISGIFPEAIWAKNSFRLNNNFQLNINAFATLGVTGSDSNALGFRRELTQKHSVFQDSPRFGTDSRFGLQFGLQYRSLFELNAQLMANDQSKDQVEDYIRQAFMTAHILPTLNIRAGRLPIDAFLLSEFRDVGYAYLWARPVPEFYAPILLNSFDGLDGAYKHALGNGTLEFRLGAGKFDTLLCLNKDMAPVNAEINNFWNASLQYSLKNCRFRLSYVRGNINTISSEFALPLRGQRHLLHYLPPIPDIQNQISSLLSEFNLIDSNFSHASLAAMCENKNWIIQSEVGKLEYEKLMNLTYWSGYLSVGYHMGNVTPFVVVSRGTSSSRKFPTHLLQYAPHQIQPMLFKGMQDFTSLQSQQTTLSLGIRWDVFTNTAVKLQWNHHWVTDKDYLWGDGEWENEMDSELNTYSINVDFLF